MEDGTIRNKQISASSSRRRGLASAGRLNAASKWSPNVNANSWIEVDLTESTVVSGVITQGGPRGWGYVTRYKVSYQTKSSPDRLHVTDERGNIKVFIGNNDGNTPVTNVFKERVEAVTVRIQPTKWRNGVCLRIELVGCRRG
ncbi:lactadherin-like [Acanthaster planci]|uniref:Lactadherin-like n=1 Tax=Acanthaster planci TaxID=133434 RepID=A0A8B7XUU5_ACAPL|nr:lactadherin-like [Acanthaster planci]